MKWAKIDKLTLRQEEALEWAAEGFSAEFIAEQMGVGLRTVKTLLYQARQSLDARNTTYAVAILVRAQTVPSQTCTKDLDTATSGRLEC